MSGAFGTDGMTFVVAHSFETDDYISPYSGTGKNSSRTASIFDGCRPLKHEYKRVMLYSTLPDGKTTVSYRLVQID